MTNARFFGKLINVTIGLEMKAQYRPELRLAFSDMWGHGRYAFHPTRNYFYKLLSLYYNVSLVDHDPDLLIFSCFGNNHKNISAKTKLFFCGENSIPSGCDRMIRPDYSKCDISLSQYPASHRNYYFPLWALFINWFHEADTIDLPSNPTYLTNPKTLLWNRDTYIEEKTYDCCFMNNNHIPDRVALFELLNEKIFVNSYGKLHNNVGYLLRGHEGDKCDILKNHKLTIAYENSYRHGYNTEKIIHPYSVGSIPIYSGGLDRTVFNSKALFYIEDYASTEAMVEDIVSTIGDTSLYRAKLREPLFVNNIIPDKFKPIAVLSWIAERLRETINK